MNTHHDPADPAAEEEAHLAAYLGRHPDFFLRHPDLAINLQLPSPHGDRAISLSEKQLAMLREKNTQLEAYLAELMRFGEENDVISARVHKLAIALLGAPDQAAVLRTLSLRLAGSFVVPHIALRLWGAMGAGEGAHFAPVTPEARNYVDAMSRPYCGQNMPADLVAWFETHAASIRSFAAVPLREGKEPFGLLLMGSEEPERFFAGMGTLYLEWIGELAAAALLRTR